MFLLGRAACWSCSLALRFPLNLLEMKQAEAEEEKDYDVKGYAIMRTT
jgi:hypothetical protein